MQATFLSPLYMQSPAVPLLLFLIGCLQFYVANHTARFASHALTVDKQKKRKESVPHALKWQTHDHCGLQ